MDQERAHLHAALLLAPNDPTILSRLGYVQIGAQWLSPEQIERWRRLNREAEISIEKLSVKLERIAQRLEGTKGQRAAALRDLRAIANPSAIPAIELILAGRDEETALVAVETLRSIEAPESAMALAKQGIFSKWPAVRKSAATALKEKKREDFVPPVLSLLAGPAQGELKVYFDEAKGSLVFSHLLAVETEDQYQVSTLEIVNEFIGIRVGRERRWFFEYSVEADLAVALRQTDVQRALRDRLNSRTHEQEAINDRIRELNDRTIGVLAVISGNEPDPEVRKWLPGPADSARDE